MVDATEMPLTYEQFFADEYPRLVPMLHALTGDRGRAEDLAQESLARAHREWHRIGGFERPGAWSRRVALNLAANSARSSRREQRALRRLGAPSPGQLSPADEHLWSLVRDLPEQQRAAVVLHYVDDLSVARVAEILEVSHGTVKTHLSRARATLAGRLAETDPEEQRDG